LVLIVSFQSCEKEKLIYLDDVREIKIAENITIDNGIIIRDPVFNYVTYDNFLSYLVSSDRFLIVQQKDFKKATSNDKVIISLRHDIDDNINASVKFAHIEHKYGIQSTYFLLHTANYYGKTKRSNFKRNENVINYLKKIQDYYGHEVGWHNDLVTLQVIFGIAPKEFLSKELLWLRENGINIIGTSSHGSDYCYIYHYVNSYFWKEIHGTSEGNFFNWEYIPKGYKTYKIEKDNLASYNFKYECSFLDENYFFADSDWHNGKRWHMGMVDLDSFKPGEKIILLIHPQHWEQ
jgi:hypothetical protein